MSKTNKWDGTLPEELQPTEDENAAIDRLIAAAQTEERKKCAAYESTGLPWIISDYAYGRETLEWATALLRDGAEVAA